MIKLTPSDTIAVTGNSYIALNCTEITHKKKLILTFHTPKFDRLIDKNHGSIIKPQSKGKHDLFENIQDRLTSSSLSCT